MNSRDRLLNILKDKYEYEQDRRKSFDNMLNLPITLLAFLTAGATYILNGDDLRCYIWFITIKPYLLILIFVSSSLNIYFIYKVYFEYKRQYNTIPEAKNIKDDFENVSKYNYAQKLTASTTEKNIDSDFMDFIIQWYVTSSSHNSNVNDKRAKNYYTSKKFIGIAYCILIITFLLYFSSKL